MSKKKTDKKTSDNTTKKSKQKAEKKSPGVAGDFSGVSEEQEKEPWREKI